MAKKAEIPDVPAIVAALGLPGETALVALLAVIEKAIVYETELLRVDPDTALAGRRRWEAMLDRIAEGLGIEPTG